MFALHKYLSWSNGKLCFVQIKCTIRTSTGKINSHNNNSKINKGWLHCEKFSVSVQWYLHNIAILGFYINLWPKCWNATQTYDFLFISCHSVQLKVVHEKLDNTSISCLCYTINRLMKQTIYKLYANILYRCYSIFIENKYTLSITFVKSPLDFTKRNSSSCHFTVVGHRSETSRIDDEQGFFYFSIWEFGNHHFCSIPPYFLE